MDTSEFPPADDLNIHQLNEELSYIEVLILSLDPEGDNYHERLAELDALQARYTDRLKTLNAESAHTRSQTDDQIGMDGATDPSSESWWLNGMPGSDHSNLGNGFSLDSQREMLNGIGIKRQRAQTSHLNSSEHPSKRQTPEPSNAGTPASSDGSYDFVDREPSERARRQQLAAEATARRQYESTRADAAFARELNQQSLLPTFGSSSSSRPSFQTTFGHNGAYQRPSPVTNTNSESPSTMRGPSAMRSPQYPQPLAYQSQQGQGIKAEPGSARAQQLPQRPRQPTQVVDLTGSDSDEDISEIAPNIFTPNRRYPAPQHFNNQNNTAFEPARSLHGPHRTTMQMPTTMHQMPGAYPASQVPASQYVYNQGSGAATGNDWLSQTIGGIRDAAGGLAEPVRDLGRLIYGSSSSRPLELDDDDDDIVFRGSGRRFGNYAGQEDLWQDRYDALRAYDSTKTREEIRALLENIRPDEELPAHLRAQTPEAMSVKLHKYQELGLTWLKNCEEGGNKGGILADDMGLGKTIQMLALMVSKRSQDPRCKTTLIIAPVALMRQWAQEIQNKVKAGHKLTVFTHHGTRKAKDFSSLRQYDVVLTTYGSISSEMKKIEKFQLRRKADRNAIPYPNERCVFLGPDTRWYRVILDEAQCIKNRNTQSAKGACLINAQYRFCVTGTPMMNNVEEFYSLIKFLRIKPYCHWDRFRLDIHTPLRSANDSTKSKAMSMLQALCKAVMLRRTKQSKFEGQPILVLPERSTTVDNPVFSEEERDFYKALETKSQLTFNKYLRRGEIGTSYSAILVLLLRLRQACCHPHLIQDFGVAAAADLDEDKLVEFASQLAEPVVTRIKEAQGNFECPVCYDVTQNPAIFIPCGHDACSECFGRLADPSNAIQNGEDGGGIKCPNCRGPIDPKRLTDFTSFKKVHQPELLSDLEREALQADEVSDEDGDDDDEEDSGSSTEEDAEDETDDETLGGFIVKDDQESDSDNEDLDETENGEKVKCEEQMPAAEGVAGPSNSKASTKAKSKKARGKDKDRKKDKGKRKGKGKGKKKEKKAKPAVTLAELKKMASRNKAAKKRYLRRLRKDYVGSAKIDKTMELLEQIMTDGEGEKVLIFSQWTSLLDLLEIPIDGQGYGYRRYDGSMTATMRGDAVDDFRDESQDVRIMLVSLKAGNAGLNLNMASQVIILDPFWNPYIEEQAIDRAHRFGQMRPVKVHRVLIQETVEDRIIALQEKKRALISEALDETQARELSRLGPRELAYLFGVTHDPSQNVNYMPRGARR